MLAVGYGFFPCLHSDYLYQCIIHFLYGSIPFPFVKVIIDCLPRWIFMRYHSPLATCLEHIPQPVHYFPHVNCSFSASVSGRDILTKNTPFVIGEVRWVGLSHTIRLSRLILSIQTFKTGSKYCTNFGSFTRTSKKRTSRTLSYTI